MTSDDISIDVDIKTKKKRSWLKCRVAEVHIKIDIHDVKHVRMDVCTEGECATAVVSPRSKQESAQKSKSPDLMKRSKIMAKQECNNEKEENTPIIKTSDPTENGV